MGMLVYHSTTTLVIDDRVLAHLQVVMINKLRRRESFTFTWRDEGGQDSVCWIGPSVALEFVYSGNRHPLLNREWLELLARAANSNSGLMVMPEPAPATRIDQPIQPRTPSRPVPLDPPPNRPQPVPVSARRRQPSKSPADA
ncbi:hypothetical protein J2X63_002262 [Agromyces sp. 3263]|uniref:DUF7882 family protein n=1 Tax=Agromyces sp. 3263 TaxID=2817750 RepID=UPI002858D7D0|nr:ATP-dependent DNA ligase [Agromyces sp. 3263]MDR6906576.1 hypothetical protein [Agromyces sp. 3263]